MHRHIARNAVLLTIPAGLLLVAQAAALSGGAKYPKAEPLMRVSTSGEKSFPPGVPGRVDSVAYVITQTDLDTFGPADKRFDRSSTVRPVVLRSLAPPLDLAASLRGVNQKGDFTWDVFGYARSMPGVYRDDWQAFNDLPTHSGEFDPPVRFIRVVELVVPGTPPKSFPPLTQTEKMEAMRLKGVDDEKLSKELWEAVEKSLPVAEQQLRKNGKELEIALEALPEGSRALAEKYIEVRWSRGWAHLQDTLKLDRNAPINLWISPASYQLTNVNGRLPNRRAQQLVGINGMLTDGRNVFF